MINLYNAIGLGRNPFVAKDNLTNAEETWLDRGYSTAPKIKAKQLVQILGDKGFGKSSHLNHWRSPTGGSYCYYPPGLGRWKFPKVEPIVYWDEADRIPFIFLIPALLWASLTHATIAAGTHRDLSFWAKLCGLTVTTITLPPVDAETLQTWAIAEINAVTLPGQTCPLHLSIPEAETIIKKAHGSWRSATDYLHIWAAAIAKQTEQNNL
ncbi:MAG: hypothetical protein HC799_15155 [Limnothrix sp. RL_2_0]|nr:hypothetical protein [Limnothrix sp. RL_2_0]